MLAVEISDATAAYDLNVKVPLYARHGVPEVWVLGLAVGRLHRYSEPAGGRYAVISSPAGFPRITIAALDADLDLSPLDL